MELQPRGRSRWEPCRIFGGAAVCRHLDVLLSHGGVELPAQQIVEPRVAASVSVSLTGTDGELERPSV